MEKGETRKNDRSMANSIGKCGARRACRMHCKSRAGRERRLRRGGPLWRFLLWSLTMHDADPSTPRARASRREREDEAMRRRDTDRTLNDRPADPNRAGAKIRI